MVKGDLFPSGCGVALFAFGPVLGFMGVVQFMARQTICRSGCRKNIRGMAGRACRLEVLSRQGELGPFVMVKRDVLPSTG